jgi:hypothetical protein
MITECKPHPFWGRYFLQLPLPSQIPVPYINFLACTYMSELYCDSGGAVNMPKVRCSDLCDVMVTANILQHEVKNQQFRNFVENYMNQYIPTDPTLQKTVYVPIMKMS